MKKTIFVLLALLMGLLGCAPYLTYEELEAEAILTGDETKLLKREAKAQRAGEYYENKWKCVNSRENYVWFCTDGQPPRQQPTAQTSIDRLIRLYKREDLEAGCGCWREADAQAWVNQLLRGT